MGLVPIMSALATPVSAVAAPPRTAGPVLPTTGDAADLTEELLRRIRWTAHGTRRLSLDPAGTAVLDGPGIRLVHVTSGAVVLRSSPADVSADPLKRQRELPLQPGDVALLPHCGRVVIQASSHGPAAVLTAAVTIADTPFDRPDELLPAVLFSCGFRLTDPSYAGLLELVDRELSSDRPGTSAVVERLLDTVVSAALRSWLEQGCGNARAWIAQSDDPSLRRALEAIHAEPGTPWRVADLARLSHTSRSQFAERFRSQVGQSPARYVTSVRMRRAEELLRAGRGVSEIAFALGYDSDEGFSRAFRRHHGQAPREWRRQPR